MEGLKVKHTPGPWTVEQDKSSGAMWVQAGMAGDVCDLYSRMNGACILYNNAHANAALIAAAPAMRELLSLAVCYVDNVELKSQIYRLLGKIDGVGDTFAKAEGRQ